MGCFFVFNLIVILANRKSEFYKIETYITVLPRLVQKSRHSCEGSNPVTWKVDGTAHLSLQVARSHLSIS